MPFSGAVLTGGASRRMGRDKAVSVLVEGRPMAQRVADALVAAGATEVLAIGGDGPALARVGLTACPDDHPGEGPLGGILTALRRARHEVVVVVACDLAWLDAATVSAVVGALDADPGADCALARTQRLEPLCGAWRRAAALPALTAAFAAGERAPVRAVAGLVVREVAARELPLRNVNAPSDLAPR